MKVLLLILALGPVTMLGLHSTNEVREKCHKYKIESLLALSDARTIAVSYSSKGGDLENAKGSYEAYIHGLKSFDCHKFANILKEGK